MFHGRIEAEWLSHWLECFTLGELIDNQFGKTLTQQSPLRQARSRNKLQLKQCLVAQLLNTINQSLDLFDHGPPGMSRSQMVTVLH